MTDSIYFHIRENLSEIRKLRLRLSICRNDSDVIGGSSIIKIRKDVIVFPNFIVDFP